MSAPFGNPLLQVSPFASDCGELIGRDPRDVPPSDWQGNDFFVGLKAIRAKCLDCAYEAGEVRKCVQTDCPLWPLRMGTVPNGFKIARERAFLSGTGDSGRVIPGDGIIDEKPAHGAENDAEGGT